MHQLLTLRALRYVAQLFVLASALNYPWELAQGKFFNGMNSVKLAWAHCLGSAVGDGGITLVVYLLGSVLYQSWAWSYQMEVRKYLTVAVIGFIMGGIVEWVALNLLHRWSYTADMPVIPILHVGIFPLLQMVFLLPIIFFFAGRLDLSR